MASELEQSRLVVAGNQKWIIELINEHGGSTTYGEIQEEGERRESDTVGAMINVLKRKKVITFEINGSKSEYRSTNSRGKM